MFWYTHNEDVLMDNEVVPEYVLELSFRWFLYHDSSNQLTAGSFVRM